MVLKIVSSNESGLYNVKYIENILTGLMIPQRFTKPYYLCDESQVILIKNYNKDKKDSYNIESKVIFSRENSVFKEKHSEVNSSHLMDTIQNLADVIGYFSNEIIKLDRIVTPSYLEKDKGYFEKFFLCYGEINTQNMLNPIPFGLETSFGVRLFFKESCPINVVNYSAQISFEVDGKYTNLFLKGNGNAQPYLNRLKLEKLLKREHKSLFCR